MISLATPPFFIFSLLKRQMDKVYCKVGSALGKTVQDERREEAQVRARDRADEARNEARSKARASERRRGVYAVGEAAGSVSSYNY